LALATKRINVPLIDIKPTGRVICIEWHPDLGVGHVEANMLEKTEWIAGHTCIEL
jgi:hypothetical protein